MRPLAAARPRGARLPRHSCIGINVLATRVFLAWLLVGSSIAQLHRLTVETQEPTGSKPLAQQLLRLGLDFTQKPVKPDHEQAEEVLLGLGRPFDRQVQITSYTASNTGHVNEFQ